MTPLISSALLATQSDTRLASLAADGHDMAFEAIVERYRRPLGRYLRRLLSGPLAEDVLQATFVNAWRSLQRGTEVRDLRPWLYRIAHNQAINALARAEPKLGLAPEDGPAAEGPEVEVERRDVLARTLTAISGLPERQRAALVAVAVEDRPHPDVAAELGLSEGALRQLVHRARTSLRAAATAVVPTPLVTAAASAGHDTTVARIAEVATGAGGAGLAIKAGTGLVAATALIAAAPAVHEGRPHPSPAVAAATHAIDDVAAPAASAAEPARATAPAPHVRHAAAPTAARHRKAPRPAQHGRRGGSEREREQSTDGGSHRDDGRTNDDNEHRGSGSSGSGSPEGTTSRRDDGGSDDHRTTTSTSGPGPSSGSGDDGLSGSSGSGSGESGTSGSSGGGSDDAVLTTPVPTATATTPEPLESHSGRDASGSSGTSGSGPG